MPSLSYYINTHKRVIFTIDKKIYYIIIRAKGYSTTYPLTITIKDIQYLSNKIRDPDLKINDYMISILPDSMYISTESLLMNTPAKGNLVIGKDAMKLAEEESQFNIALGTGALYYGKGNFNIAIGSNVLANSTGSYNIGIGTGTLNVCKKSQWNIAIGQNSLGAMQFGDGNIVIGVASLPRAINNIESNIVIGNNAGNSIKQTSVNNIYIGTNAFFSAEISNYNIAVGNKSAMGCKSGSFNVLLGEDSGLNASTINYSTLIGYSAGAYYSANSLITRVTNSTFIGSKTKFLVDNPNNAIVIGYNTVGRANNSITLGDLNINKIYCKATSISTNSDIRLKEEIKPANIDMCLQSVKDLPVKRYKYKDFVGKYEDIHVTGWLADDVEKVFPKCVGKTDMLFPILDENGQKIYEEIEKNGKIEIEEKSFVMKDVKDITMTEAVPTLWGAVQCLAKQLEEIRILIKKEQDNNG